MKNIIFLSILLFGIACAPKTETESEAITTETVEKDEAPVQEEKAPEIKVEKAIDEKQLLGYYVGAFRAVNPDYEQDYTVFNKINISIDEMTDGNIWGHSVVAGNDRPFEGSYERKGNIFVASVSEPGDDRYDGTFVFKIYPEAREVRGDWYANNKELAVARRKFTLDKRLFTYDPNLKLPEEASWARLSSIYNEHSFGDGGLMEHLTEDVLTVNPSSEKLTKSQVENMYKGDLEVIRNSIYARHGYSFKNRKMRFLFDQYVDWYIPVSTDIRDQLTDLEKENIALLKRYEDHADKYYDSFGR
ncbi:MAG: YARHG domain-containing protein [Bacteroidota bacterium]